MDSGPQLISVLADRMRPVHSTLCLCGLLTVLVSLGVLGLFVVPSTFNEYPASRKCLDNPVPGGETCAYLDIQNASVWKSYYLEVQNTDQFLYVQAEPIAKPERFEDEETVELQLSYVLRTWRLDSSYQVVKQVFRENKNNQTITCKDNSQKCSTFELFLEPELEPGNYMLEMQVVNQDLFKKYFEGIQYESYKMNPRYTYFTLVVYYVAFIISVFNLVRYTIFLALVSYETWVFEQYFTLVLSVLVVLFNDPLIGVNLYYPAYYTVASSVFFKITFISALLLFWIVQYERIYLENDAKLALSFSGWKIITMTVFYIFFLAMSFVLTAVYFYDPSYHLEEDHWWMVYAVGIVAFTFLLGLVGYIIYCYVQAIKLWKSRINRHKVFIMISGLFVFLICFLLGTSAFYLYQMNGFDMLMLVSATNMYVLTLSAIYTPDYTGLRDSKRSLQLREFNINVDRGYRDLAYRNSNHIDIDNDEEGEADDADAQSSGTTDLEGRDLDAFGEDGHINSGPGAAGGKVQLQFDDDEQGQDKQENLEDYEIGEQSLPWIQNVEKHEYSNKKNDYDQNHFQVNSLQFINMSLNLWIYYLIHPIGTPPYSLKTTNITTSMISEDSEQNQSYSNAAISIERKISEKNSLHNLVVYFNRFGNNQCINGYFLTKRFKTLKGYLIRGKDFQNNDVYIFLKINTFRRNFFFMKNMALVNPPNHLSKDYYSNGIYVQFQNMQMKPFLVQEKGSESISKIWAFSWTVDTFIEFIPYKNSNFINGYRTPILPHRTSPEMDSPFLKKGFQFKNLLSFSKQLSNDILIDIYEDEILKIYDVPYFSPDLNSYFTVSKLSTSCGELTVIFNDVGSAKYLKHQIEYYQKIASKNQLFLVLRDMNFHYDSNKQLFLKQHDCFDYNLDLAHCSHYDMPYYSNLHQESKEILGLIETGDMNHNGLKLHRKKMKEFENCFQKVERKFHFMVEESEILRSFILQTENSEKIQEDKKDEFWEYDKYTGLSELKPERLFSQCSTEAQSLDFKSNFKRWTPAKSKGCSGAWKHDMYSKNYGVFDSDNQKRLSVQSQDFFKPIYNWDKYYIQDGVKVKLHSSKSEAKGGSLKNINNSLRELRIEAPNFELNSPSGNIEEDENQKQEPKSDNSDVFDQLIKDLSSPPCSNNPESDQEKFKKLQLDFGKMIVEEQTLENLQDQAIDDPNPMEGDSSLVSNDMVSEQQPFSSLKRMNGSSDQQYWI